LICACCSDGSYSSLVICQNEVGVHIMRLSMVRFCLCINWETTYLVHEPEDNLLIGLETPSKLTPERAELGCCGCSHIRGISDDTASRWLLGGVVVSHVVVRIQDGISTLGDGDIIDGSLKFGEVLENFSCSIYCWGLRCSLSR
jgi:hypothetical protein